MQGPFNLAQRILIRILLALTIRPMLRRRLTSWLVVFTLLIGQMAALDHATSHLAKPDLGLFDHVCELCLSQLNLGNSPVSAPISLPWVDAASDWIGELAVDLAISDRFIARARAPPAAV